jgi:hypothetical protein
VSLVLALLPLGLLGVGVAVSGTALAVGVLDLHLARRVVGIPWSDLARPLLAPLLAGGAAVAVVAPLEHVLVRSDGRGVAAGLGLLLAEALLLALVYLGVLRVVAPEQLRALRRAAGRTTDEEEGDR